MTLRRAPRTAGSLAGLLLAACGPTRIAADGSTAAGSSSAAVASGSDGSESASEGATAQGSSSADSSGGMPSPRAVEVTAGAFATCARSDLGEARCWGEIVTGGPTIGDDEPAALAPALSFADSVVSLTAGLETYCALLGNGELTCWGRGNEGMLGYGDTVTRPTPTAETLDLPKHVSAVSLEAVACALYEDGSVQSWGPTLDGITGTATGVFCGASCFYPECCLGDHEVPASWPAVVVGAEVAALSVGTGTVAVLTPDGRVRNWGSGWQGGLGFPWPVDQDLGDDETPATGPDVDVGGIAVAVAAGLPSCALLEDGTLRCWGGPAAGYGVGEIVGDDETPASMGPVALPAPVVQIDASWRNACARLEDGAVYCWGDNSVGQLGLGHTDTIGDDETPLDAGPLDLGGPAVAISVGAGYACAILDDGMLRCWGNNDVGQLGYGHTQTIGDDETPASAGPVPWLP